MPVELDTIGIKSGRVTTLDIMIKLLVKFRTMNTQALARALYDYIVKKFLGPEWGVTIDSRGKVEIVRTSSNYSPEGQWRWPGPER